MPRFLLIIAIIVLMFLFIAAASHWYVGDKPRAVLFSVATVVLFIFIIVVGVKPGKANTKSSSTSSFTNKYGSSTTKCVVSGCDNKIASSGDTNCCTTHSNKCLECKKYIDGDAMYCMDCIEDAF